MRAIVSFCLRFPLLIVFAALGIALLGVAALVTARYGVFPEFGEPTVKVVTNREGLAPRQIEALVTIPIENALNGLPGLKLLRSKSMEGVSAVEAVFHANTGIYRDRELVAERLAPLAAALPPGTMPVIAPLESSTGTVLAVGLTSNKLSLMQLTELARWTIEPALLAVPGVSVVSIIGARPEELQVQFDPKKLFALDAGLNELTAAAAAASAVTGAGVVDTPNQRIFVFNHGQAATPEALAKSLFLRRGEESVALGDVARVVPASPPPIGSALVYGKPGLALMISSQYGANTLAVTDGLDRALRRLSPIFKDNGVVVDADALRPASYIVTGLRDVRNSLAIGAALIVVVLYFALRNWRTAAISFTVIPFSLLAAAFVLDRFGYGLNALTLGGLAIALGEVVDDSVVGVENIHRRMRENRALPRPRPALPVILDATLEVRRAVIFATLSVVIVFLPILHLGGVAGRLFAPLATAYIFAILASLAVALTLIPALSILLLARSPPAAQDPPLVAFAKRVYGPILSAVDQRPLPIFAAVILFLALGLLSVPALKTRFLPPFRENDVIVHYETAPGTSIKAMLAIGRRAVAALERLPEVGHFVAHVGRSQLSPELAPTNRAEIDIGLSAKGAADSAAAERDILAALQGMPGVRFWANTFLAERISEILSGVTAPIVVTIYGRHLAALNRDAERVAAALRPLPGAAAVRIEAPRGTPELSIRLDRNALTRFGFSAKDVLRAIHTSYAGSRVGRVYTAGRSFPIVVVLPPSQRADPSAIVSIPLASASGNVVLLGKLARIEERSGQSVILHRGAQRAQLVTVNVTGGATRFLERARRPLAALALSAGDYLAIGGTATASTAARLELLLRAGLALAAVLGLLVIALRNARAVTLLAVNLPFSLVGGIAAVWITGIEVSLGAVVGFVTVFGITLRNALMLLAYYRTLVVEEGRPWSRETARLGAMHRLAPILMTASVTALGLLPLAVGAHLPGQEIQGPMAIVILGGLLSSTALTLLVLPALALRYGRFEASREEIAAERAPHGAPGE